MPPRKRTRTTNNKSKNVDSHKRQHLESKYSIFITNINSKIKSNKMKENLFILFSSFADVLQVHYPRKGYRGKAWIIVSSQTDAIECINKLNGFEIFDAKINVSLARKEGKIIDRLLKAGKEEEEEEEVEQAEVENINE